VLAGFQAAAATPCLVQRMGFRLHSKVGGGCLHGARAGWWGQWLAPRGQVWLVGAAAGM
jgi:hypothetical protein